MHEGPAKGKDKYAIELVHQQVKQMGWITIVCKCDPENATHLIVEELAKKRAHPTIPSPIQLVMPSL